MINFLSSWAEQIIIAIIIASIIEMILPDNKNKKYIKMIIGIYILFNIISPIVGNIDIFSLDNFNLESYAVSNTVTSNNTAVNQESMDARLQDLYVEELKKNIEQEVSKQGYKVESCNVDAVLYGDEEKQGINKIKLVVTKMQKEEQQEEVSKETNNVNSIEKVEVNVGLNKYITKDQEKEQKEENTKNEQNLKNVLSKIYEIDNKKIDVSIK